MLNRKPIPVLVRGLFIFFWPFFHGSPSAQSMAGQSLLMRNACTACHAQSSKLIGPSFDSISSRYGASSVAVANLVKSIKAGGSGKWGAVPMPAQSLLSETDAEIMAAHILGYSLPVTQPNGIGGQIAAPHTQQSRLEISIDDAKVKCLDLGFKPKTEEFGKCVLRLSQ